eukprot:11498109-Alexandrium_andersonii.AAC.1
MLGSKYLGRVYPVWPTETTQWVCDCSRHSVPRNRCTRMLHAHFSYQQAMPILAEWLLDGCDCPNKDGHKALPRPRAPAFLGAP